MSPKRQDELRNFARDGKGSALLDTIKKEDVKAQTLQRVLGGSQTANNIQDIINTQGFDPSLATIAQQNGLKTALVQAAARGLGKAGEAATLGNAGKVRSDVAKALMATSNSSSDFERWKNAIANQSKREKNQTSLVRQALKSALFASDVKPYFPAD